MEAPRQRRLAGPRSAQSNRREITAFARRRRDAETFHNPGIQWPSLFCVPANDWAALEAILPENQARHDFWAGLHIADALFLFSFPHRANEPVPPDEDDPHWAPPAQVEADPADYADIQSATWRGYRRGAGILRDHPGNPDRPEDGSWEGFREAMANGERILGTTRLEQQAHIDNPVDWITERTDAANAPAVDYGSFLRPEAYAGEDLNRRRSWLKFGRTEANHLPAVQWSARRLGNVVWLIVSHGYRPTAPNPSAPSLETLGSFGFDADLGIAAAWVIDATDLAVPDLFPDDSAVQFEGWEAVEHGRRYRFGQIDAMLVRFDLKV